MPEAFSEQLFGEEAFFIFLSLVRHTDALHYILLFFISSENRDSVFKKEKKKSTDNQSKEKDISPCIIKIINRTTKNKGIIPPSRDWAHHILQGTASG